MFVGRRAHLAGLTDAMRTAKSGRPQLVFVQGEAGIGKSALVQHWLHDPITRSLTVLQARCDPSETDMAFGMVVQLVSSVSAAVLTDFPTLQRIPADAVPFQVGAQLLRLFDELQRGGPLAVVVDDVHWGDPASVQALSFVIRRVEADSILFVLVSRTGAEPSARSAEDLRRLVDNTDWRTRLTLPGLDAQEVGELVERLSGHPWDRGAVERLRQHTDGSPLYVQTVLSELSYTNTADIHVALPVPESLSAGVLRQLAVLSDQSRRLVEAAAVLDSRSPLALVAAVAGVDDPMDALEPLLEQRLLEWSPGEPGAPVAVSHALQRDAVLSAMRPSQLRRAHAAAAGLVSGMASWRHRVAAAGGQAPESLAAELEQAAGEYIRTGALGRAGTLLLWASDASHTREAKERRLLTAAAYLMWGDDFAQVTTLLPRVRECAGSPLRDLVLGAHATSHGLGPATEALLQRAMAQTEGVSEQSWVFAMAATWLGLMYLIADCERAVPVLRQVVSMPALAPGLVNRAKGNMAIGYGFVDGPKAGLHAFARVADLPPVSCTVPADAYLLALHGMLGTWAGELSAGRREMEAALRLAAESSYSAVGEFAYSCSAASSYLLGEWDRALISAQHGITVTLVEDKPWASPFAHAVAAWVPAGRGAWARAEELLRIADEHARGLPPAFTLPPVAVGHAVLAQARRDHTRMLLALAPVTALPEPGMKMLLRSWWWPLYVEALIGVGDLNGAETALADLVRLAAEHRYLTTATAWLSGWLAETRGDLDAALAAYSSGTDRLDGCDEEPLHRALLEQAFGRVLGAVGEREAAARLQQAASDRFHRLGAVPFRDRCDSELVRHRLAARRGRRADDLRLSERERNIAHLVCGGYTNKEIARELFISSKTVEYHLGNIYSRFHLENRRQLRDYMNKHAWAV